MGFQPVQLRLTRAPAEPRHALSRPFYALPLKGIQVKIRVFEPDSRQIREITVVEDFLWE